MPRSLDRYGCATAPPPIVERPLRWLSCGQLPWPALLWPTGVSIFNRSIVWLEADQAPGCFDQRRSQARIAMFGHAALYAGIAATVFPGVTANSPSIAEALPVADDRHSVTDVLTAPLHQSVVRDL